VGGKTLKININRLIVMKKRKLLESVYDIAFKDYPELEYRALEIYYMLHRGNVSRMSINSFAEDFIEDYYGSSYDEYISEYRWIEPTDTEIKAKKALEFGEIVQVRGCYFSKLRLKNLN